ncbi:MAG: alpha/beta fold hydrolase [Anaerolineae bacterium]|nr:alpha/beta fold hydrolase [Anaerolineae bacterium]
MPDLVRRVRQALAATAGLALFNLGQSLQAGPLMSELPGQTGYWTSPQGKLFYKTVGTGEPLVLLHGFNAGASSYEMRRIVAPLAEHFQVYALDWLGFGLSDRPKLRYTADLYVSLLDGFLRDVVKTPTHVVVSSLASAYVIQHAAAQPDRYRRLVLVAPTGIETLAVELGAPAGCRCYSACRRCWRFSFNLLVTPQPGVFPARQGKLTQRRPCRTSSARTPPAAGRPLRPARSLGVAQLAHPPRLGE